MTIERFFFLMQKKKSKQKIDFKGWLINIIPEDFMFNLSQRFLLVYFLSPDYSTGFGSLTTPTWSLQSLAFSLIPNC